MGFSSVNDFLQSMIRGRPQTLEEIKAKVDKSPGAVKRELRRLVLFGDVRIVVLRFNNRHCPFYTMRHDVKAEVIKQGTRY